MWDLVGWWVGKTEGLEMGCKMQMRYVRCRCRA